MWFVVEANKLLYWSTIKTVLLWIFEATPSQPRCSQWPTSEKVSPRMFVEYAKECWNVLVQYWSEWSKYIPWKPEQLCINQFEVVDHFCYSHELKVWFRGDTVRRNQMLVLSVILCCQGQPTFARVQVQWWCPESCYFATWTNRYVKNRNNI